MSKSKHIHIHDISFNPLCAILATAWCQKLKCCRSLITHLSVFHPSDKNSKDEMSNVNAVVCLFREKVTNYLDVFVYLNKKVTNYFRRVSPFKAILWYLAYFKQYAINAALYIMTQFSTNSKRYVFTKIPAGSKFN